MVKIGVTLLKLVLIVVTGTNLLEEIMNVNVAINNTEML